MSLVVCLSAWDKEHVLIDLQENDFLYDACNYSSQKTSHAWACALLCTVGSVEWHHEDWRVYMRVIMLRDIMLSDSEITMLGDSDRAGVTAIALIAKEVPALAEPLFHCAWGRMKFTCIVSCPWNSLFSRRYTYTIDFLDRNAIDFESGISREHAAFGGGKKEKMPLWWWPWTAIERLSSRQETRACLQSASVNEMRTRQLWKLAVSIARLRGTQCWLCTWWCERICRLLIMCNE